jgi:hypothetical protein
MVNTIAAIHQRFHIRSFSTWLGIWNANIILKGLCKNSRTGFISLINLLRRVYKSATYNNPFKGFMNVINHFINVFWSIFQGYKPSIILFFEEFCRVHDDFKNGEKGFVIRCTFINQIRVFSSALFFYSVAEPVCDVSKKVHAVLSLSSLSLVSPPSY